MCSLTPHKFHHSPFPHSIPIHTTPRWVTEILCTMITHFRGVLKKSLPGLWQVGYINNFCPPLHPACLQASSFFLLLLLAASFFFDSGQIYESHTRRERWRDQICRRLINFLLLSPFPRSFPFLLVCNAPYYSPPYAQGLFTEFRAFPFTFPQIQLLTDPILAFFIVASLFLLLFLCDNFALINMGGTHAKQTKYQRMLRLQI